MRARRRTGAIFRAELAAMGRTLDDVRAVVLTHGHSDHIGFAERIRRERHDADPGARGWTPRSPAARSRTRPRDFGPVKVAAAAPVPRLLGRRTGCCAIPRIAGGLDVRRRRDARRARFAPGHPRSRATRRAAPRSISPVRDALFVGDAIATYAVTTGIDGPQHRAVHRRPGAGARVARPARRAGGRVRPARPRPGVDGRRRGGARGGRARPRAGLPEVSC